MAAVAATAARLDSSLGLLGPGGLGPRVPNGGADVAVGRAGGGAVTSMPRTTIWPWKPASEAEWMLKVPSSVKVLPERSPGAIGPLSNEPSSAVTEWGRVPWLTQVIDSPAWIVI